MDAQTELSRTTAVLLLADQSALEVLGGLTQLDRLLLNLAETFAGVPNRVTVLWRTAALREAGRVGGPARLPGLGVQHAVDGEVVGAVSGGEGTVLLLASSLVLGRGTLPRLLADPAAVEGLPLRAVPGEELARNGRWDWDALAARLPVGGGGAPGVGAGFVAVLSAPGDLPSAERRLLRSLGKPSDGYVARLLNRPVSTAITRLLARTSVTPDRVSLLVLGLALGAAWLASRGSAAGFALGCLLNQSASILDGCDGELARLKFLDTRRGAWLDTSIDMLGNHLFIFAMGLGLSRQPGLSPTQRADYFWEGVIATTGLAFCVWAVARLTRATTGEAHFNNFGANIASGTLRPGLLQRLIAGATPLFRRDVYALVFLALALAGRPAWILHFFAVGMLAHLPAIAWAWWHHHPAAGRAAGANRGTQHA